MSRQVTCLQTAVQSMQQHLPVEGNSLRSLAGKPSTRPTPHRRLGGDAEVWCMLRTVETHFIQSGIIFLPVSWACERSEILDSAQDILLVYRNSPHPSVASCRKSRSSLKKKLRGLYKVPAYLSNIFSAPHRGSIAF